MAKINAPTLDQLKQSGVRLTQREAELWELRFSGPKPLSNDEIAEKMGTATGTISRYWHDIKAKIGFDPMQEQREESGNLGNADASELRLRNVSTDTNVKLIEMAQEKLARRLVHHSHLATIDKIPGMIRDLTNARALMKGEPTQILKVTQAENLRRALPAMARELARRGITFETDDKGHVKRFKRIDGNTEIELPDEVPQLEAGDDDIVGPDQPRT